MNKKKVFFFTLLNRFEKFFSATFKHWISDWIKFNANKMKSEYWVWNCDEEVERKKNLIKVIEIEMLIEEKKIISED